jgi:hypothetical protein
MLPLRLWFMLTFFKFRLSLGSLTFPVFPQIHSHRCVCCQKILVAITDWLLRESAFWTTQNQPCRLCSVTGTSEDRLNCGAYWLNVHFLSSEEKWSIFSKFTPLPVSMRNCWILLFSKPAISLISFARNIVLCTRNDWLFETGSEVFYQFISAFVS